MFVAELCGIFFKGLKIAIERGFYKMELNLDLKVVVSNFKFDKDN